MPRSLPTRSPKTAGPAREALFARRALSLLLLVGLFAFGIRAFRLGAVEPWFNESYSGLLAFASPSAILRAAHAEVTPPLYYLALRGWAGLFGQGPVALRALSALCGALFAAILCAIACRASVTAGIAAGLFVAVAPIQVQYAREARMYAMLLLLLSGAIACLLRAMSSGGVARMSWWAAFAILSASAIYTHYVALFVLIAFPPAALVWGRGAAIETMRATLVAGLLALPLVPWVLAQARLPATSHIDRIYHALPPPLAIPRTIELFAPGALYPMYPDFLFAPPIYRPVAFLLLAAVLLPAIRVALGGEGEGRRLARMGWVLLFAPLLLLSLCSLARPVYFLGRYDLVAFPGFAILTGIGVARLRPSSRGVVALAALALCAWSLAPCYVPTPAARSISTVVRARLLPALRRGDVLLFTGYGMPGVRYALLRAGRDPAFVTMPLSTAAHAGWVDRRVLSGAWALRAQSDRAARAARAKASGARIWLLWDRHEVGGEETAAALERLGYRAVSRESLVRKDPMRWSQPLDAVLFVPHRSDP